MKNRGGNCAIHIMDGMQPLVGYSAAVCFFSFFLCKGICPCEGLCGTSPLKSWGLDHLSDGARANEQRGWSLTLGMEGRESFWSRRILSF